ncbi:energy transducer TonB [Brevundimonas sp. PAMC22021]|uniref:energy transducer TonB n=1 Tax=Brevundimonas sp. PAMC22021 TaxID=2861285 RepID=UPI001C62B013|nr:energy transducer TonB [Brevundimonas sp. PAMC22021]QYF85743.1 energy transducer TonB [Brevundimonas sp. PAMC22021]
MSTINPSISDGVRFRNSRRGRDALVGAGVLLAHLGLFVLFGRMGDATAPSPDATPIDVALVRPPQPPVLPPPVQPAPTSGGGAPAAPSVVHVPPQAEAPPELPAPRTPAPEPALTVGVSDQSSVDPGLGQGGEGEGTGVGTGSGDGPGAGATGPRFVRGPSNAELARLHPAQARGGLFGGRASGEGIIHCLIRLDRQLEQCSIVSETPPGRGFGVAALQAAGFFRFDPPTRGGRAQAGEGVTLTVSFR